jgi:hypothetical protein
MDDALDFGPQFARDDPFTARMRFHQSWYRAAVLHAPVGTGPKRNSATRYGNLLTEEDANHGLNFLARHIAQVVKRRVDADRGSIDRFRLFGNLLSGQALAFNLFAPLVDQPELATRLIQAIHPDPIQRVTRVSLAWAPRPANDYLNDLTSFDVFIEYLRPDGARGFAGVESRLADAPAPKVFASPRYRELTDRPDSAFEPGALAHLLQPELNPLWRAHLLAEALLAHPASRYAAGRFLLLVHPHDSAQAEAAGRYAALLKPERRSFATLALDALVAAWQAAGLSESQQAWLAKFEQRYLDLAASEEAYAAYRAARGLP